MIVPEEVNRLLLLGITKGDSVEGAIHSKPFIDFEPDTFNRRIQFALIIINRNDDVRNARVFEKRLCRNLNLLWSAPTW